ncbi:MAG: glycosyltransferase family 9 protein [Deferribacteres bacterium]|nr:glycosyltransferase family 9 protein [Deferribacteres bacterium]
MIRALLKRGYIATRRLALLPLRAVVKQVIPETAGLKNILFLRHDGIGDMVLSTPVFRALKEGIPHAVLTVLAGPGNRDVLSGNPFVDEVMLYEPGLSGTVKMLRELRRRSFDIVIDPFLTYKLHTAFLALLSGAGCRLGFAIAGREVFFNLRCPEADDRRSISEQTLDMARALGLNPRDSMPRLYVSTREREAAWESLKAKGAAKGDILVGIHPGGRYESQRWPAGRFAMVADYIMSVYNARVVLFGAEGDREAVQFIRKVMSNTPLLMDGVGLRSFIAALSCCRLLICNNSGPLHIASALGIPSVSTMGPTVPWLWWPRGEGHIVIRKDLPCSPCSLAVCASHRCMKLITVEEVIHAAGTQLDRINLDINAA